MRPTAHTPHVLLATAVVVLSGFAAARASTIVVDLNGGGDYTTIKSAALVADEGDTVLVAPGTCSRTSNVALNTEGKNRVFESESGADETFLDGEDQYAAFYITDGQDTTTVIRGFTLTNCHPFGNSGAMEISNASPVIENCLFDEYTANFFGGGIGCAHSSAVVRDCTFRDCVAGFRGGAIYVSDSFLRVSYCIIAGTVDGHAVYDEGPFEIDIHHCVVFGNADGDSLPPHNDWGELVGAYGEGCDPCNTSVENATWSVIKTLFR
jgi:hypothetical protein